MSYVEWDWDQSGWPSWPIQCSDDNNTVTNEYQDGTVSSRSLNTVDLKTFNLSFPVMYPPEFGYVEDFFNTYKGGSLFIWRFPLAMAGNPGAGGAGPSTPSVSGWDNDSEADDAGAGEGPAFLCRFVQQKLDWEAIGPNIYRINSLIVRRVQ